MPRLPRLALLAPMAVLAMVLPLATVAEYPVLARGEEVAAVRVVHASPDAPAVDVYVDDGRTVGMLAFGAASDFVPVPAGVHDLAVVPAGADPSAAVIRLEDVPFDAGAAYQIAALGALASIEARVFPLDLAPLPPGRARIRVIHASPDAPAVDVTAGDGEALFSGLGFADASEYAEVDAGVYDLTVRRVDGGADADVLAMPNTLVNPGDAIDVVAVGSQADGSLMPLVLAVPAHAPSIPGISAPPAGFGPSDPSHDYTDHGFARRALQTPAGRMLYYEAGDGSPLVFLHGVCGGCSAWNWSKIAPAFVDSHRVIVAEFVGWGGAEHPSRPLLGVDYVAQIDALLDAVGEPSTVVAESLATGWAIEAAHIDPKRVGELVLMSPSGGKDFGDDAFEPEVRDTLGRIASSDLGAAFYPAVFFQRQTYADWFAQEGFADPAAVSDEVVDAFWWSGTRPGAEYSALPFLSGELRYDIAPLLRDLTIPATMVWGAEETVVGPAIWGRLADVNPDVALVLVPRTRFPSLELPAQTIAVVNRLLAT